jgi:catechol 2,3-dioxygenase-like lactoylglutathione lyase family enzyme
MPRSVHSALKVDDLEKATEFYEKGFGFVEMETGQVIDHTSRHLTDGTIDLALIKYDSEESAEAPALPDWDRASITSPLKWTIWPNPPPI